MFCPKGYIPYSTASVWFDEWLEVIVKESINHGDPLNLKEARRVRRDRFSVFEVTKEKIWFLENCQDAAICGFDGTLLKVDHLHFLERVSYHWLSDWFPEKLVFENRHLMFLTPSMYTIDVRCWEDILSEAVRSQSNEEWERLQSIAEVVSKFQGWAYCISEEDDEKMLEYIVSRFSLPSSVLEAVMKDDELSSNSKRRGRPPLRKAKAEFAKMGYSKGSRSWEQLARHLEKKTGEKPSPKTLRTWTIDAS